MRWGLWGVRMDAKQMQLMIEGCLALGIDTFDHADIYGGLHSTEADFGSVIGPNPSLRDKMKIITKCGIRLPDNETGFPRIKHYDTSARYIISAVEASLKALQTERIELLLIHRPDPLMKSQEVAEAFFRLKKEGKVLHFGVSNFKGSQLRMVCKDWPMEMNQLQISIEHPQAMFDGSIDACMELGVQIQAWSPLGSGSISADAEDERSRKINAAAEIIARRHACDISEVLIAWVLAHPSEIKPVLGTSRIDRMKSALSATSLTLEKEEWFMLLRASLGRDVP